MLHSTQERLRDWHALLESGGAVTGGEVEAGSVTGVEVEAGSVTGVEVEAGAVTGVEVEAGAEVDAGSTRGYTLEHDESPQQE